MKYKVGDRVIASDNLGMFKEATGTIVEINEEYRNPYNVKYDEKNINLWSKVHSLSTVEKIVITHDGKTTTATLYRDGEKVKATAKCAPEDKFDFMVGAKLAMERLVDKTTKPEPPKYYTGKVVCVANDCGGYVDTDFTPGKVYEIIDGNLIDNHNTRRPACTGKIIKTLDDLNTGYFTEWFYKFIPYVE